VAETIVDIAVGDATTIISVSVIGVSIIVGVIASVGKRAQAAIKPLAMPVALAIVPTLVAAMPVALAIVPTLAEIAAVVTKAIVRMGSASAVMKHRCTAHGVKCSASALKACSARSALKACSAAMKTATTTAAMKTATTTAAMKTATTTAAGFYLG
jgi:hypothetical protein